MKKCNTIRTSEDKANFIASNMTLESKGFNDDGVLMFDCYVDKAVYTVLKIEIFNEKDFFMDVTRTFFSDPADANMFYREECDYLRKCSDDDDYKGRATIALIENKLSFNVTISIEALNVSTFADMFDEHLFKYCEIFSKNQLNRKL